MPSGDPCIDLRCSFKGSSKKLNATKKRQQNISDLDSFFTRVYEFHQQHGLLCMFLQSAFDISQYIFIIWFTTELRHCVDYDMLFSNGNFTEERRYVKLTFQTLQI